MRSAILWPAILIVTATGVGSAAFGQECLRPEWTACVSFPNGGRHTGVSIQREQVSTQVPAGAEICVINNEEIGGYTYARFARNGVPWPNQDWGVDVDNFCFYKN